MSRLKFTFTLKERGGKLESPVEEREPSTDENEKENAPSEKTGVYKL